MRLALVAASFLLLSGCASPGAGGPGEGGVEIIDIHGLALDAEDASVLYVATHRGLLRLDEDARWSYVGDARDDLMGFSAHPREAGIFWASGHPARGGNLGLLRSEDAGVTWTPIALPGADLHAMAVSVADPSRLYGSWRGDVIRSDDGGDTWRPVAQLPARAFATHPTERDVVYATTGSAVLRSDDAGARWSEVATLGALGLAVDPAAPEVLYAGVQRAVLKSENEGRDWSPLAMPHEGSFAHFATHVATPGLVYVASYQKGIYKSEDHGATWRVILAPSR